MEKLLQYFVPEKYDLDLRIDKYAKTISGVIKVTGTSNSDTVKFHAVGLSIDEVLVDGGDASFECRDDLLIISSVPSSASEVQIAYHGSLNENMQGAYLSTYHYDDMEEVIVATQFESHYAREAFPCIDEPAAKAEFHLSITTPEEDGEVIISNTPEESQEQISEDGKSFTRTTFKTTPPMSTYLLAWVIGRFSSKSTKTKYGTLVATYAPLNQEKDSVDFANEIAVSSLEFYEDNFKIKYPLEHLYQVALPDFEAGAMENWGLVAYRESMLLAGNESTLSTKKSVALTVAHELAHQWFGNLVTMEWWDDLWLNESFASVMEYYAVDYIHPEYHIFEDFFTGDCLAALRRDAFTDVQSVHQEVSEPAEIATLFDPAIVYAKGAHLMLMLIRAMGWDKFVLGIHDYFEEHKYHNTIGDDLWTALTPYADFDVQELMHSFIDRPGYPVITSTSPDFQTFTERRFLLDSAKMPSVSWPISHVLEDMSGHYILNLTDDEFSSRLDKFNTLSLEEKLRLLIDRSLVTKTTLASSASLLPLVQKFAQEDSAAVWSIVLTIINSLKIFFRYDSEEETKFRKFVGDFIAPKISELGLFTRKDDNENILRLRAILLSLDFYARSHDNLTALANEYNNNYASLDREVRVDILDAKIYLDPAIFDEYLSSYQKVADPELKYDLLLAMTLSRDESNIKKMVKLLSRPDIIKPQDHFHFFIYLYRNPSAREAVFSWLTTHWDYVREISGDKSMDNYPRYIASSIRTEEEAVSYRRFFATKKSDPALARAITIGESEIASTLALIAADGAAVHDMLSTIVK